MIPWLDKWYTSQSSVHELALGKYTIVLFYNYHGHDRNDVIIVKASDVPMQKSHGKFASISATGAEGVQNFEYRRASFFCGGLLEQIDQVLCRLCGHSIEYYCNDLLEFVIGTEILLACFW